MTFGGMGHSASRALFEFVALAKVLYLVEVSDFDLGGAADVTEDDLARARPGPSGAR